MWNLVDYKIFRFSCWGHELFLALLSLGIIRSVTFNSFLASRVFLDSFVEQQSAENWRGTLCSSQELSPQASLFPWVVLSSVDYILLTSPESQVPSSTQGSDTLGLASPFLHTSLITIQAVTLGNQYSTHLFLLSQGSLFCLVWNLMYEKKLFDIFCVIFSCFRWMDISNSYYLT